MLINYFKKLQHNYTNTVEVVSKALKLMCDIDRNMEEISTSNTGNESSSPIIHTSSRRDLLTTEIVEKWTQEQNEYRKSLILYDTEPWQINRRTFTKTLNNDEKSDDNEAKQCEYTNTHLRYIAGMDISFVKDDTLACSGLFVFDISEKMKLVYEDLDNDELINMDQPYVPGFLAYREAPFLLKKLEKLKREKPWLYPHCIFIDGNGVLHGNKFGVACHIGLLSDTPTIGCSKKLYQVFGLENNIDHKQKIISELKKGGDYFELLKNDDNSKELLGYCYRPTDNVTNPIYVSIGHKISWETCLWLLKLGYETLGWQTRVPEPIRQADILTREFLRKNGF